MQMSIPVFLLLHVRPVQFRVARLQGVPELCFARMFARSPALRAVLNYGLVWGLVALARARRPGFCLSSRARDFGIETVFLCMYANGLPFRPCLIHVQGVKPAL